MATVAAWQTEVLTKLSELGLVGEADGKSVRVLRHKVQVARLESESGAWRWIDAWAAKTERTAPKQRAQKLY